MLSIVGSVSTVREGLIPLASLGYVTVPSATTTSSKKATVPFLSGNVTVRLAV